MLSVVLFSRFFLFSISLSPHIWGSFIKMNVQHILNVLWNSFSINLSLSLALSYFDTLCFVASSAVTNAAIWRLNTFYRAQMIMVVVRNVLFRNVSIMITMLTAVIATVQHLHAYIYICIHIIVIRSIILHAKAVLRLLQASAHNTHIDIHFMFYHEMREWKKKQVSYWNVSIH